MAAPPQQAQAQARKATGMPSLEGARIDLGAFRAHARADLLSALDSVAPPRGSKHGVALVLDPSLSGPLGLVAEVREFREHGVEKIYHLLPEPLQTECTSVVYLIRPQLRLAEQVAAQVRALEKSRVRSDPPRTYTLFFVPRRSMLCEKVLADEGVHDVLGVRELPLPFFVLEDDVLSLEQPQSCFRDCFHDDDRSLLHACAASLARMQALFGKFPTIRGKELLLLDRDVDLVTPLCTELTYEGLIHDQFGIAHGYVDLDPEILAGESGASGAASKLTKKALNNNDPLYAQIRNLNFGELGPLLNRLARDVSQGYDERHQAQTVTQIRDYMKKLSKLQQEHKSLSTHVALAERIQRVTKQDDFHQRLQCEQEALSTAACSSEAEALIEELAANGEPLPHVLRLLCLLSLVSNGFRAKTLAHLQSELTQAYGYHRLALTWPVLSRLGLLKRPEGRNNWPSLRKALRLVVESMPDHELGAEEADLAYVYAGYAPLSVRLLHAMGVGGTATAAADVSDGGADRPPVTLVFFIGGCTYAEIAALRWLSRNATPRREYLIATTHICNGDTLMESVVSTCDNQLEHLDS